MPNPHVVGLLLRLDPGFSFCLSFFSLLLFFTSKPFCVFACSLQVLLLLVVLLLVLLIVCLFLLEETKQLRHNH